MVGNTTWDAIGKVPGVLENRADDEEWGYWVGVEWAAEFRRVKQSKAWIKRRRERRCLNRNFQEYLGFTVVQKGENPWQSLLPRNSP